MICVISIYTFVCVFFLSLPLPFTHSVFLALHTGPQHSVLRVQPARLCASPSVFYGFVSTREHLQYPRCIHHVSAPETCGAQMLARPPCTREYGTHAKPQKKKNKQKGWTSVKMRKMCLCVCVRVLTMQQCCTHPSGRCSVRLARCACVCVSVVVATKATTYACRCVCVFVFAWRVTGASVLQRRQMCASAGQLLVVLVYMYCNMDVFMGMHKTRTRNTRRSQSGAGNSANELR